MQKVYIVNNLDCANCGGKIESEINKLESIEKAVLNFTARKLKVTGDISAETERQMQKICDKIENGYYYFIAKNIRIYLFKIWQLLVKKNSELIQLGFLNDEKWFAYIEQNNNDNENIAMLSILSLDIFINSLLLYIEEYRLKKYPHEELLPIIRGKCRCDYGYVCF